LPIGERADKGGIKGERDARRRLPEAGRAPQPFVGWRADTLLLVRRRPARARRKKDREPTEEGREIKMRMPSQRRQDCARRTSGDKETLAVRMVGPKSYRTNIKSPDKTDASDPPDGYDDGNSNDKKNNPNKREIIKN
jgi:hypothetical protein